MTDELTTTPYERAREAVDRAEWQAEARANSKNSSAIRWGLVRSPRRPPTGQLCGDCKERVPKAFGICSRCYSRRRRAGTLLQVVAP
jgi:hypothetical protein